jgi:hypothetical protein
MDFENAETLTEVDDTFVTLLRCNKSFIEKVQFWSKKSLEDLLWQLGICFLYIFPKLNW